MSIPSHGESYFFFKVNVQNVQLGLSPTFKYFTDRSKAVLLLWIICVIYVLCVCHAFASVYCYLELTCCEMVDLLALVSDV